MRHAKKRASRAQVPAGLMGKRDGLFFLWGQIERARLNLENNTPSEGGALDGSGVTRTGTTQKSLQSPVDEFIFF